MAWCSNGTKKSRRGHPERRRGISQNMHRPAAAVLAREILHVVQDDRTYGGVMHRVVVKWNKNKLLAKSENPKSEINLMSPFVFWIFAVLTVIFGAAVVLNRNPVASALSLVVSFLGLSALFMSLDAFFVGIIQVLVYAGAVMVLFLFIIMLLHIRTEERRRINWIAVVGGVGVAVILLIQIYVVIGHFQSARRTFPPLAASTTDDVWQIGRLLFSNYNLPFQIIGVLVLVATIGVVLLSRREPR